MSARHGLRRGFTLVEIAVASGVMALVLGLLAAFQHQTAQAARRVTRSTDALRSALLATEAIRRDARRLIFRGGSDLALSSSGRSVSMLVPDALPADLTGASTTVVRYGLNREAHGVYRLVRTDQAGAHTVAGCRLKDLRIAYLPRGQVAALKGFLEITATGVSDDDPDEIQTCSCLVPLERLSAGGAP